MDSEPPPGEVPPWPRWGHTPAPTAHITETHRAERPPMTPTDHDDEDMPTKRRASTG